MITADDTQDDDIDDTNEDEGFEPGDLQTGVDFTVEYLLQHPNFAEWWFCRNRWDAVESEYDRRKKV